MGVNIERAVGQLGRTVPTEDAVICIVFSGTAVAGKIALSEPKQIFSVDALTDLGITAVNNPVAYRDIVDFYGKAGEGAELNFMLISDATSLTDICDVTKDIGRKLLDFTNDRAVIFMVNRKPAAGYEPVITQGMDGDVWTALTKLNEMAIQYDAAEIPFTGFLPGLLFDTTKIADMPNRSTLTKDYVAVSVACEKADGHISMGVLAAWLAKHQVHQNVGRIASGPVVDSGFFPDAVNTNTLKASWSVLNTKAVIYFYKERGKSGYFFNDDSTMTTTASDYSSVSWNRTITKAKRIANRVLVEKLKDDIDLNPTTGKIESGLLSDWESEVENAVRAEMINVPVTKRREISGVQFTINPDSDIVNDKIDGTINIVRKGQVKQIDVKIGYVRAISE